jgi:hypothetical protein
MLKDKVVKTSFQGYPHESAGTIAGDAPAHVRRSSDDRIQV